MPVGGTSDTWQLIPSPCTNDNCCTPSEESIRFLIDNNGRLNVLQKPEIIQILLRKFKDAFSQSSKSLNLFSSRLINLGACVFMITANIYNQIAMEL